ncbi:hypothetical protein FIBSPDRAFT_114027 [Athelia psychrophila]|uniref:Uncharacterized protein n=1 Tax=Athelia psychrophila TaxID=1759441 RepID=A0A166D5G5_9AGAM|nr:hypothetical protein FIBSPDRAFT_114027 [Fibularhizoctonia sp. CBS 109695]
MNTEIAHLLNTNHAPTTTESQHVKAIISEKQGHLAQLESEIERLRSLLDPLLRTRDETKQFLSAHVNILSPARRMPAEIWSDIFTKCLPDEEHAPIDCTQAPLLLTQICRAWRSFASSTPQLWSSISVEARGSAPSEMQSRVIKNWLSRSGTLPLSIKVDAIGPLGPKLVNTLVLFGPRVHSLDIMAKHDERQKIFDASMPTLSRIEFRCSGVLRLFQLSGPPPNLRRLLLPGMDNLMATPFPWAELTALDVTRTIQYNECFLIFHRCHSLSRLALPHIDGAHDGATRQRVTLRHLLFLHLCPDSGVGNLLDNLTLPNLKELNIAERNSTGRSNEVLLSFLTRSACPIDTLTISSSVPAHKLREIVQWVRTLRSVHLAWPAKPVPVPVVQILGTRNDAERTILSHASQLSARRLSSS